MANPRIEVEIGAKTDNLIRGVDGVILSMKQLKDESKKIEDALETSFNPDEVTSYNAQLAKLKAGMNALKTQGVEPLTKATSNYNGVGVEFSRIIQDAPFGIIGVGNNITRLAETFQNLRTQSTSTGAALKTALSSIISPANLLVLGISAVTTALTLWQMGAFESSKSAKSLADAAKEAKEEMEEFRLSLDAVTQARIKGESSASKEIGDLKLLREQAENTNVTQKKRLEAVDALQKQYPDTLGNLSKEQILTGQVGTAYEGLTKQIIATSKARAFSDKISENSLELLTLEEKSAQKVQDILEKRDELERRKKKDLSSGAQLAGQITAVDTDVINTQDQLNDLVQEQLDLVAQRNKINAENATLEAKITEQVSKGATFTKESVVAQKTIKESVKEIRDIEAERLANLKAISEIPQIKNQLPSTDINIKQGTGLDQLSLKPLEKDDFFKSLDDITSQFEAFGGNFNQSVADFALNLKATLQSNIGNAFVSLGQDIGAALATGQNVIQAVGKSLLKSMGNFLGDLGKQLIAIGTAGLAFSTLIETIKRGGPAAIPAAIAAIGVGVGLVALASAFQASAGKGLGGGGGGGGSVGSSVASQSFSGGGVGGLGGGNRDLTGELVVRGNDLVYVLGQSNNKIAKG